MNRPTQLAPGLLSLNAYHYPRGGADAAYLNHAALFERNGWRTAFSSMKHPQNLPCSDEEYFVDEIDFEKRSTIWRRAVEAKKIIYSNEARKRLRDLILLRKPDVAHVHSIYHHQSPSVLDELKANRLPVVLTAHDLKLACPAYTMLNRTGICERCKGGKVWNVAVHKCIKDSLVASSLIMVESAVHKLSGIYRDNIDYVVTPSEFYRTKLLEWGWNSSQVVHIPNFVDTGNGLPAFTRGEYILYFGRLSSEKGLETLVQAAAVSRVPTVIAGRGPFEGRLRDLVTELAAPVRFAGYQAGDALSALIDGSLAVVLPSEWYENGPLSVIEGFARGKPLIGANIGGIPELLLGGDCGWGFESSSVSDLAATMLEAWSESDAELRNYRLRCSALVRDSYSPSVYYKKMVALYGKIRELQ